MTLLAALLVAAAGWFPAADWTEAPDPCADPHARKGGTIRFYGAQPPKSLNAYLDTLSYVQMTFALMYETLLGTDPATGDLVPALARRWRVSEDGSAFTFELDPRARWSDGRPVTAADVTGTFDAVTDPANDTGPWKAMLAFFERPAAPDAHTVVFRKKGGSPKDWRDILNASALYVLPMHAVDPKDLARADLATLPVSGPYRLARVSEQVESVFARVPGWWRADFPSCRHRYNFDTLVMRYYQDGDNAFEAFVQGSLDVYPVYTARIMAERTGGKTFAHNWTIRRAVRNHRPIGFQGFAMNQRRKPFDDVRVREAMCRLVDRETMNRTMMSGAYFLQRSYYGDLYDAAHPCTNELWTYDVAAAKRLLAEAGYADGFDFAFLSRSGTEDKFLALFDAALRQCNVRMRIVRKDLAGWMRDMDAFNFDMTWAAWGASLVRYPELMWSSAEADRAGSQNLTGFRDAEVDRLIAAEKTMTDNAARQDAYRKIDAILARACPYVLLWNADTTRLVYWNKFGMPKGVLSKFDAEESVFTYWWYDTDKAEELRDARATGGFLPSVPFAVDFDAEEVPLRGKRCDIMGEK